MAKINASVLTGANVPRDLGLTLRIGDLLVWDDVKPLPAGLDEAEVDEMERHLIRRGMRTFTHGDGLVIVAFDHCFDREPFIAD